MEQDEHNRIPDGGNSIVVNNGVSSDHHHHHHHDHAGRLSSASTCSSLDSALATPFEEDVEEDDSDDDDDQLLSFKTQVSLQKDLDDDDDDDEGKEVKVEVNHQDLKKEAARPSSTSTSSSDSLIDGHQFVLDQENPTNHHSNSPDSPLKDPKRDLNNTENGKKEDHVSENEPNLGAMPPPTQVMERPKTGGSEYRIPSHVFARTNTSNPAEWSVASNESLFSIHMGNSSFTREQMMLKAAELGTIGEISSSCSSPTFSVDRSGSGHVFDFSASQKQPGEYYKAESGKSSPGSPGIAAASIETMKSVLRENEAASPMAGEIPHHRPSESNTSNKSFAFSKLPSEEKSHSPSTSGSAKSGGENQQTGSEKGSPTPAAAGEGGEAPAAAEESSSEEKKPEKKPPAGAPFGSRLMGWFSCLPCCKSSAA